MAEDETPPPSRAGGGLSRKVGPFPMWVWAVGVGGLGGIVWFWRKSKSQPTAAADSSAAGASGDTTPTSLVPINEGLSQDQANEILKAIKKLHGKDSDDDDDDHDKDDDDDDDKPKPKPKPKPPAPKPKPKPKPKPHHPRTVTTVKWHRGHVPWNSTLWGIATHEHVAGGWQYLQKINHLHGDPRTHLQPGMKIKLSP